jgi:hypothetical protein
MFRNALRQSTRAVGALSASSRVAVVSVHLSARPTRPQFHRPVLGSNLNRPCTRPGSSIELFYRGAWALGEHRELGRELLDFDGAFGARLAFRLG